MLTFDKCCLIVASPSLIESFEMIENFGHDSEIVNTGDLIHSQEIMCSQRYNHGL